MMRFNKLPEDDNQPKNDEPYNENQQLLPGAEQPKGQTKKKNIFHQHAIYPTCNYPIPKPIRFIDSEISSNLPFQKLLYFNVFYSILFFYILLASYIFRWMTLEQNIYNLLRLIFIFIPWGILEIFRINHGYTGNIKETFPEILSFLIQTVINFAVVIVQLIFPQRLPIEVAVLSLQLVFYVFELIFCIIALSNLSKSQSALFFWNTPYQKNKFLKREEVKQKHAKIDATYERGPAWDRPNQSTQFGQQGPELIPQANQSQYYNDSQFPGQENVYANPGFVQTNNSFGQTFQSQNNDNRFYQTYN